MYADPSYVQLDEHEARGVKTVERGTRVIAMAANNTLVRDNMASEGSDKAGGGMTRKYRREEGIESQTQG